MKSVTEQIPNHVTVHSKCQNLALGINRLQKMRMSDIPDTYVENIEVNEDDEKAIEVFMSKNPMPQRTLADTLGHH